MPGSFFFWGRTKSFLARDDPARELTLAEYFAAGAITGFFSTFVEAPIDFFKSQLQTQIFLPRPAFSTFPAAVRAVVAENGPLGVYQGLSANLWRTVPATGAYFGAYEATRRLLAAEGSSRDRLPSHHLLFAGGVGGFAYWASIFPLDSIKSAMQAEHFRRSERRYRSVADCASKLYAEGGVRRFFRGIVPCLLRSFPANAACFFAYEKCLSLMSSSSFMP